jgi:hypothetical protein
MGTMKSAIEPYHGDRKRSVTTWAKPDDKIHTNQGFVRVDKWVMAEAYRMNCRLRQKKYRAGSCDGLVAVVEV